MCRSRHKKKPNFLRSRKRKKKRKKAPKKECQRHDKNKKWTVPVQKKAPFRLWRNKRKSRAKKQPKTTLNQSEKSKKIHHQKSRKNKPKPTTKSPPKIRPNGARTGQRKKGEEKERKSRADKRYSRKGRV